MKRIVCFLTLIICFCMTPIQAQKKMMSQEEFRKQQQMFLTERAGLTPEEAKNFFPLYFELQDKKRSYNKEAWQKLRKGKEAGTTEAEYDRIIEDVLQTRITPDTHHHRPAGTGICPQIQTIPLGQENLSDTEGRNEIPSGTVEECTKKEMMFSG